MCHIIKARIFLPLLFFLFIFFNDPVRIVSEPGFNPPSNLTATDPPLIEYDSTVTTKDKIAHAIVFPNPFSILQDKETYIQFVLGDMADVVIKIYTPSGEPVWESPYKYQDYKEGQNKIPWNGTNDKGEKVVFGGYICKILVTPRFGGSPSAKIIKIGVLP